MSQIDWSKAPEGATHYHPEINGYVAHWVKRDEDGGNYFCTCGFENKGWKRDCVAPPQPALIKRPEPPPWTGEGLPPVGTVCEFKSTQHDGPHTYEPVEIMYISKVTVVAKRLDENRGMEEELICHPATARFRPIRTPEQIAAQARSKACDEMFGIMSSPPVREGNRSDMAEALYDAGYRKFEIVEN